MGIRGSLICIVLCILLVAALSGPAFADSPRDRTQFGHDVSVAPGEEVTEVTCFGCSVRIRGKVSGDVTTFGGNILVEDQGEVGGDTTAFGGSVRLDNGAKVNELTIFAGRLRRDPGAMVGGDVTTFTGTIWLLLIFGLPFAILGGLIALIVWLIRRVTRPAVPLSA
jgi:hypothetical protein